MLGNILDDLNTVFSTAPQYVNLAARVLADPAFPEVVQLANRIADASSKQYTPAVYPPGYVPPLVAIPAGYPPGYNGVGLDKAIMPLKAFAWYVENPILAPLALLAAVALPVAIGYYWGKGA